MPLPTAIACLVLAIGFILLFFGARLSRFGFVLGAVAGAGLLAVTASRALGQPEWQGWLWSAAAAGLACLLASVLFRLWMGVTGLVFMAILVTGIVVIWQGPPLPALHAPNTAQLAAAGAGHAPKETLGHVWHQNLEAMNLWWNAKTETARQTLRVASAIGGILGLGLGLAVPLRAAALQCAVGGAGLCLIAAHTLAELHAPDKIGWLPGTPRALLLVLLILAAVGFAAQGGAAESDEPEKADPPAKKKAAE